MTLQKQKRLVNVLEKIKKRYCSIFFSKLILYGDDADQETRRIRHYDIECQAASNIVDILQTKIKAIQLKCLYFLKQHRKTYQKPLDRRSQISYARSNGELPKYLFSKTSRNAASTVNFDASPLTYKPREVQLRPIVNRGEGMKSQISQLDYSMNALMSKVKNLSDRFSKRNESYYCQDVQTEDYHYEKMKKRRLILSKLNKLENDLSNFLQQQNSGRYETTSNVSYRRNKQPNIYSNYNKGHMTNKGYKNHTNTSYFSREEIYGRNW